jgi:hypothetical protein
MRRLRRRATAVTPKIAMPIAAKSDAREERTIEHEHPGDPDAGVNVAMQLPLRSQAKPGAQSWLDVQLFAQAFASQT